MNPAQFCALQMQLHLNAVRLKSSGVFLLPNDYGTITA